MAVDDKEFERQLTELDDAIYALCYKMMRNPEDAEDAKQDAITNAWRGLAGYEPRPDKPFQHWVLRIATNACLDLLRKRKGEPVKADDTLEDRPDSRSEQNMYDKIRLNEVLAAMKACLDERDYWMFLQHLAGMPYNEIAEQLPTHWKKLAFEGVKARFDGKIKRCREQVEKKVDGDA